ncbi:MFS transporter [Pradoshia sp. D12]|uniref:MDR family MFS transporter n=1 Tax=Bacillaceae TaxID=186817 RepID=UPI00080AD6FF|nr:MULTISPECIES: MFS transporter [Bacillaceae]OCA83522.1 permease [Bacillus sp. FJAT-27986]QFK71763.1 MFS transporter [Pradoshia sp. D12]TPF73558.1 MFS transporter [Bacillus sp. D12]
MKLKNLPQNIKVRLGTSFFNRMASSSVMPFMALYFAHELNKIWAGVFLIFTVLITFVANLLGGYLSDRFKRKKILLMTSSTSAFMFLMMTLTLIPENDWVWLFAICYVGYMISSSLGRPSMSAIIMDSTTKETRKFVYALDYWLINLSMAIGAAMGGLLYSNHQLELFIILTCTSTFIAIAYKIWLIEGTVRQLKQSHKNFLIDLLHNYKIALQDTRFVKLVLGFMFILSAEFSLNSYIGVRLSESFEVVNVFGYQIGGVQMLSLMNIENMLLVVLLTFIVSNITNRFSNKRVLIIGLLIYGVGYTFVTSANSWYMLLLFGFIATIGELMYSPVYNTEQANMIPEDKRGSYSAFSNISYNGADLIARSTIIIGAFAAPMMMSVYIGLVIAVGTSLVYFSLFYKEKYQRNIQTNT